MGPWHSRQTIFFIKMGHSRPLFPLFLCVQQSWQWIKFANEWNRTMGIWFRKLSLYQLCLNHCPKTIPPFRFISKNEVVKILISNRQNRVGRFVSLFLRNCLSIPPKSNASSALYAHPATPAQWGNLFWVEPKRRIRGASTAAAAAAVAKSKTQLLGDKNHYTYQTIKAILAGGLRIWTTRI